MIHTVSLRVGGWQIAAVLVIVALAYANSLDNSFHFDDEHSITGNPHIRSLANTGAFFADPQMFSRTPGSEMYRPLVLLSYALNYWAGEYSVRGYHLVNIGTHLALTYLVFLLLQHVGGASPAAAGALLIGLHPLGTEPVNYISSRSESMAATLGVASFLLYLRTPGRPRLLVASLGCFAGALLCKSVAVSLPVVLVAYECVWKTRPRREWIRLQWPYWMVGALYLWGTNRLIREALFDTPVRSWAEHASAQAMALVYYLRLLAFPHPLTVEAPVLVPSSFGQADVVLSVLLLASLGVMIWRWWRAGLCATVFWWCWMGIVLLPTLVVPLNVVASERRLYPVLAGFVALVLGLGRERFCGRGLAFAAAVLVLGTLTVQANEDWATEKSLWANAARRAPHAVRPPLRLGILERTGGNHRQAELMFLRALEIDPQSPAALNNLGNVCQSRGDAESAERYYREAVRLLPSYAEALVNLATLYSAQERYSEALPLHLRAVTLAPHRPEVHNNLGTAYLRMERYDDAEHALLRALDLSPADASVYYNLGGALEGQSRLGEAATAYERAIALKEGYAKPYYNLARVYEAQGRRDDAASAYAGFLRYWEGGTEVADAARRRLSSLSAGEED